VCSSDLKKSAAAAAAMTSDLGYPPDLEPAIKDELAVLASIEARYADELARLERSGSQSSPRRIFASSLI